MADQQSMLTTFLHIIFVSILTHTKMPNLYILQDDRAHQWHYKTVLCFLIDISFSYRTDGKLYCLCHLDLFVLLHHQMTAHFLE